MDKVPLYALDASIAVKWHLRDEQHVPSALLVLRDFRKGRADLLAPDHVRYEVASAVRVAELRNRIAIDELGDEEWELVGVAGFEYGSGFRLFFKRPKSRTSRKGTLWFFRSRGEKKLLPTLAIPQGGFEEPKVGDGVGFNLQE